MFGLSRTARRKWRRRVACWNKNHLSLFFLMCWMCNIKQHVEQVYTIYLLDGGFIFFIFIPLWGRCSPNLTVAYFFRWVGSTTKQIYIYCMYPLPMMPSGHVILMSRHLHKLYAEPWGGVTNWSLVCWQKCEIMWPALFLGAYRWWIVSFVSCSPSLERDDPRFEVYPPWN